ncbi:HAD hydrolase-like protein [Phocaeicola sartorii]|uniref:HAD hydrolase-like protein n=1 Tax=Phocaeicola sartorii TaxID=671267 RepID=UPI002557DC6B|nr:HAD hydrolase-like protein [Phocaeicola sartorii]
MLKWSKKSGLKIYVVSDFYLPATCYNDFLLNAGCDGLIEDVFVSESINLTKRKGSLYPYVLEKTGALAEECVMIGDSRYSDVYMAEKNGIEGLWYFPLGHKIRTNISRKLKTDYSKNIFKSLSDYLYNNTCFEEYAFVIYSFAVKLFGYAKGDSVKKMAFLSRGGYFLKQAVDTYLSFFGIDDISTLYCYNSRKACFKAKDSDEDRRLLYEYLKDFMDVDRLVMVDEGWYCHSQQFIGKYLNLSTIGYYLGTRGTEKIDGGSRRGVVFNMDTDGRHSRLYGVFCTNCSMYEQMLTSSEGSVQGYEFTSSGIEPVLKENNTESELYHNVIERWQKRMLLTIKGLCAWNVGCDINDKKLAKMILRTSLFAGRERCEFLNLIDKSLVDNCKGGLQTHKNLKDVKISIGDFVVNPDMYLGQICKLQRKIYTNWFYNILYTIAAAGYYCYVRIVKWF